MISHIILAFWAALWRSISASLSTSLSLLRPILNLREPASESLFEEDEDLDLFLAMKIQHLTKVFSYLLWYSIKRLPVFSLRRILATRRQPMFLSFSRSRSWPRASFMFASSDPVPRFWSTSASWLSHFFLNTEAKKTNKKLFLLNKNIHSATSQADSTLRKMRHLHYYLLITVFWWGSFIFFFFSF